MIAALLIKFIYGFVGAIYFTVFFYCRKFSNDIILKCFKYLSLSISWCVGWWAVTIFFNVDDNPPEAISFAISFLPLFLSSLVTLKYIIKNG